MSKSYLRIGKSFAGTIRIQTEFKETSEGVRDAEKVNS